MNSLGRFLVAGVVGASVAAAVGLPFAPKARATPTLDTFPGRAAPGDSITVSGSGFGACLDSETMLTSVLLVWDDAQNLRDVRYPGGTFKVPVTVPADAPAGEHSVTLECFDLRLAIPTSGALASAPVQVTKDSGPPSLQLSPSKAAPGQSFTATGTGFEQCTDSAGEVTSVLLMWGDKRQVLGPGTGSGGAFTASLVVPKDVPNGTYLIIVECYDPAAGNATSGPITRKQFVVAVPGSVVTSGPSAASSASLSSRADSASQSTSTPGSSPPSSTSGHGSVSTSQSSGSTQSTAPPVTTSTPPPLNPSAARWQPIAWVGSAIGLLLAAALLVLVGLQSVQPGIRRRGVKWLHRHVQVVARAIDSPRTQVRGGADLTPSSLSLEPSPDQIGTQKIMEVAR
jgi:hypothetical protein